MSRDELIQLQRALSSRIFDLNVDIDRMIDRQNILEHEAALIDAELEKFNDTTT